jgi:hypothetical protein
MAQKKAEGVLDRIFEKAAEDPRGRTKLGKFLTRHHDEFEARLAQGPVNWQALARAFEDEGLLEATGKLRAAELLRRTWARVTKRVHEVREKAGKRTAGRTPRANAPVPSPPQPPRPEPSTPPPDDGEPERPKFAMARLRQTPPKGSEEEH